MDIYYYQLFKIKKKKKFEQRLVKYCLCLVSELMYMYMYYIVWCICSKYTCIGQFCYCLQGFGFSFREVGRDYVYEVEVAVSGGVF